MSDELTVADGWNEAKCRTHVANLRTDLDRYEHTAEAMREAAEESDRQADWRRHQIATCVEMFGNPKPAPDAPTDDAGRGGL